MSLEEDLKAVQEYQANPYVHPLTCINSSHNNLVPSIENDVLVLTCPDCSYRQNLHQDLVAIARGTKRGYDKLKEDFPDTFKF